MRTKLIATLFMISVASSASAQSGLFPQQRNLFDRAPAHAGHSTLTGTADYLAGDSLGPQILQDGDGAAAIYPRTDVRGPQDVIGPGLNTKERALLGAALGAWCGGLAGPIFGAAIGAAEGALSDESELREWARDVHRDGCTPRTPGSVPGVLLNGSKWDRIGFCFRAGHRV